MQMCANKPCSWPEGALQAHRAATPVPRQDGPCHTSLPFSLLPDPTPMASKHLLSTYYVSGMAEDWGGCNEPIGSSSQPQKASGGGAEQCSWPGSVGSCRPWAQGPRAFGRSWKQEASPLESRGSWRPGVQRIALSMQAQPHWGAGPLPQLGPALEARKRRAGSGLNSWILPAGHLAQDAAQRT